MYLIRVSAPHSLGKLIEWKVSISFWIEEVPIVEDSPLAGETN
jgi:hypothetical protein